MVWSICGIILKQNKETIPRNNYGIKINYWPVAVLDRKRQNTLFPFKNNQAKMACGCAITYTVGPA